MTATTTATDLTTRDVRIPARDGLELGGTLYFESKRSKRVLVLNSATAVPRRYYRHFAAALVEAGYTVLAYDYRGVGDSRPKDLRGFTASVRDWALLDMAGVIDWATKELRPERLFLGCHSVGGQIAGLVDNAHHIDGMVTFSSQSGYWLTQGKEQKAVVGFHVHVTLPLLASIFGYMPWSKIGPAEDLPKDAALEWARWCRSPNYLLDDESLPLDRFRQFEAPVLAYSFEDDKWGTKHAVDAMMRAYPKLERRHVVPTQVGLGAIGHFGYFRPDCQRLWREPLAWLDAR